MKISLNVLSAKSIQDAIDQVEAYKQKVWENTSLIVESAVNEGAYLAEQDVASHTDKNGNDDITITADVGAVKGAITAEGESVPFVEFGYGVEGEGTYPPGDPWEYYIDSPSKVTSQSGQQGWIHDGKFTTGESSHPFMYDTAAWLRDNISNIARQVFQNNG